MGSRFVILEHTTPPDGPRPLHWDLMLEHGESLATWALLERPDRASRQTCEQLKDHRLAYLEYEGPISGNRGSVVRWAQGTYTVRTWEEDRIEAMLTGAAWTAEVVLVRIDSEEPADDARWLMEWTPRP